MAVLIKSGIRLNTLLIFAACIVLASAARAQDTFVYTSTEKAGFAFYALIRQPPPFDRWIETREDYQVAKPKVRLAMMDAERARLKQGFAGYLPDRDVITIRVPVRLKKEIQADSSQLVTVSFPDFEQGLYFPFQLGDVWIAFVPTSLSPESRYILDANEYLPVLDTAELQSADGGLALTAELTLTPVKVDTREPLEVGGIPLWLMLANVQQFFLLDKEDRAVWNVGQARKAEP